MTTPARLKIIVVGDGYWSWYEQACTEALRGMNCAVTKFACSKAFLGEQVGAKQPVYASTIARLENHFLIGPRVMHVNRELAGLVSREQPDIVWFYNCVHILPRTVRRLRALAPSAILVQYANDNPFSADASFLHWRHMRRSVKECDIHLVYRDSNRYDFVQAGAKKVFQLRSYYIPSDDYRVKLEPEDDRFRCDVVFAGHYESDGRLKSLERIVENGHRLNLFGSGWDRAKSELNPSSPLWRYFPIVRAVDNDYRKAICGAKIALCYLSTLNRDTYTRRNFQIPAMGEFMLSQFSEDLASLFREGKEAEYFRTREEMLSKISYYLDHPAERERIADNGYKRVVADGHDVASRMRSMLSGIAACLSPAHPVVQRIREVGVRE